VERLVGLTRDVDEMLRPLGPLTPPDFGNADLKDVSRQCMIASNVLLIESVVAADACRCATEQHRGHGADEDE
jgi:hypothetical protein